MKDCDKWISNTLGSLKEFSNYYHDKVIEIAERYKGRIENICPWNETGWGSRGNYIPFIKDTIDDLHKLGYKVTMSTMGFTELVEIDKEILDKLDFFSCNNYPHGSVKGKKMYTKRYGSSI